MNHGSLFSGIGGFDLAAEWMGWENIFHCEWNTFGQKVLKHYWPKAKSYEDITKTDFTIYRGKIDILTGGFPCQPYSLAGKRKGKEDERHLWPDMLRAIREIRPRWVVGENVFGLINWSNGLVFHEVQAELEAEGYEVFPYVLPACAVNAPHRRDRVWFVAYNYNNGLHGTKDGQSVGQRDERNKEGENQACESTGCAKEDAPFITNTLRNKQQRSDSEHEEQPSKGGEYAQRYIEQMGGDAADSGSRRISGHRGESKGKQIQTTEFNQNNSKQFGRMGWEEFPTQSPICGGDDGIPTKLDGITFPKWRNESIKAAGNAIVPQVALQIFKAIQEYENKFGL